MDKLVISNLLRSIMNKSRESMEQRVKDMDISPQQGRMISYIVQNEDKGLIQKDLAEVFQRRGASITSMLQGLEKKATSNAGFQKTTNGKRIFLYYLKEKHWLTKQTKLFTQPRKNWSTH